MKYLFFLILPFLVYAQTTMCFKNNWNDPSTIEKEKLDGGECKGEKTIGDMKKDGWSVDDIKISSTDNGMNFIYILKKEKSVEVKKTSEDINYEKIAKTIESKKEKNKNMQDIEKGKKYYIKTCQKCHGQKGEIEVYGKSRKIKDLSLTDIKDAIRGYMWDEYDRGRAISMKPYAQLVTNDKLEQIKLYLDSINK